MTTKEASKMSSPLSNRLSRRNMLKLMSVSVALTACAPVAAPAGQTAAPTSKEASAPGKVATELVIMYHAGKLPDPLITQFNKDYTPLHLTRIDVDPTRFY